MQYKKKANKAYMNPRQAITVATACAHARLEIQGKIPHQQSCEISIKQLRNNEIYLKTSTEYKHLQL